MKIIVKTMMGYNFEFLVDSQANIRQLRTKLAEECKMAWEKLEIIKMGDKDGNNFCPIYSDDSSDETLIDFIRKEVNKPQLVIDELHVFVRLNFGPGFYRPNQKNPKGMSVGAGLMSSPENKFLKDCASSDQSKSFSERLKKIQFDMTNVPDKFCDPVTMEIMNNPVMTSSQRTFDLDALKLLNFKDPASQQVISVSRQNLQLRSEIEEFVAQQEKNSAAPKVESKKQ